MSNDKSDFGPGSGYSVNQTANVSFEDLSPGNGTPSVSVQDITTAQFMSEVVEASAVQPVLVDFWAPWCGPCKQLAPVLEKTVAEKNGAVKLVKMNIDEHPEVAGQMGIQSIPAVVAFVDGKPADAFMGAKPETEIRAFVDKLAGSEKQDLAAEALEQADELVSENALAEAANIYASVLAQDPANMRALAGMGQLYVLEDNLDAANGLLASLAPEQLAAPEIVALKSAIELAEQANDIGDFSELQQRVEKNPDDHESRLDLAIALNGANRREEAADHLLEVIRRSPGWNDDAARKQLLQFFDVWGMTDETTVSARRKLSSMLFS